MFFMSYYINFSFNGKKLPELKAEVFWLSVFEVVYAFHYKVPNVKKIE